jgi:zinc transport system ATP-binding protein
MNIISLKNINFSYNNKPLVLENINLDILAGEFIGIVGPNGGGKTTLLKIIMGLLKPTTGTVQALENKLIGYVPQFSTFNRDFPISVKNMVLMGRLGNTRVLGGFTKQDKNLALQVLQKLAIEYIANKPIATLSGGELQRAMIARALVCEPKILLLDEPTANIDIHAEQNIFDLLKIINQEGVTILIVSHDIGFVSRYIERVACLNKTLVCHSTSALTPEIIQQLYGDAIRAVRHKEKP